MGGLFTATTTPGLVSVQVTDASSSTMIVYISVADPGAIRVAIYRFNVGGQHLFKNDDNPVDGGTDQGNTFSLLRDPASGAVALYLCTLDDNDSFATTDAGCEGNAVTANFLGYTYTQAQSGTIALHRAFSGRKSDHLVTFSLNNDPDQDGSYIDEGVLGFAYP